MPVQGQQLLHSIFSYAEIGHYCTTTALQVIMTEASECELQHHHGQLHSRILRPAFYDVSKVLSQRAAALSTKATFN